MKNATHRRTPAVLLPYRGRLPFFALLLLLALLPLGGWAQCSAPTGLTVTNVAAGTATLSFTGPALATSYTVSYTFVGGTTATTVAPNPSSSPVQLTGLPFSAVVTVSVTANCGGGQSSSTAIVTFQSAAGNDEPCQAIALPLTANSCASPLAGTTIGATTTPANGYAQQGCGADNQPRDVWYTVTTAASGATSTAFALTTQGGAAGQVRLFAAPSCAGPFTALACSSSGSTNTAPPLAVAGLTPATTYYVRVASHSNTFPQGGFSICAGPPPACGDPLNLAVTGITATTAQLTFNPGSGNVSYTVTLTPQNGASTTLPSATGPPVTLPNLTPLTRYTVGLRATCASGGLSAFLTTDFTTGNANDEPATAVALPLGPTCQPTPGSNQQATTTPPNGYANPGCGGPSAQTNDVWFSFQTAATGLASTGATVTVTGAAAGQVRVFGSANGTAGPFTEIGCSATANFTAAPPLVVAGLVPGSTYFVSVAEYNFSGGAGSGGVFSICLTPPPACPAPTRLDAGSLTTTSAQLSWAVPSPGGTYAVEYGPAGFAPGSAAGTVVSAGSATSYALTGLSPNTDYDFYVTRDCGAAGPSGRSGPEPFRTLQVPGPANDDICAAFVLPSSGAACTTPTQGTTVGATNSGIRLAGGLPTCAGGLALDVFYQFTTAASGPASTGATLVLSGARSLNVLAAAACGGPYTLVGGTCANADGVSPAPVVVLGLTPGTTYYVQVAISPFGVQGPFTLCRTNPPGCNVPSGLFFPAAFLGATSAVLEFTPGTGNTGYAVTVTGPGGFTQTQTATAPPVTITGLTASTAYTASVLSTCAGGQGVPVSLNFTTAPTGPANQTCAGAFPIACGQTLTGTTVNAIGFNGTTVGLCGTTYSVMYRFAGTGDLVDVDVCSPTTTFIFSEILILSGSCGNLTCVPVTPSPANCAINPFNSTRRFRSQAGTTYYFVIAAGGGFLPGPFGLTVTCIPPPCPSPVGVTVTSLTPTTGSVAFTPAPGSPAPAYTVTATPTGGGATVTATGAASPIALTGLTANTAYGVAVVANCTPTTASAASAAVTIRTPLASRNAALAEQVGLYPNPAHRSTTLVVPAALLRQAGLLTVIDGLGRAVQQRFVSPAPGRAGETRAELDLSDLPAGVYTLRLLSSAGPLTKRLVVE